MERWSKPSRLKESPHGSGLPYSVRQVGKTRVLHSGVFALHRLRHSRTLEWLTTRYHRNVLGTTVGRRDSRCTALLDHTHSASVLNAQQTALEPKDSIHFQPKAYARIRDILLLREEGMSGSLLDDLWQTGKFAVGYYPGDKSTLISRGIDEVSPLLLPLIAALSVGHYYGVVQQRMFSEYSASLP